MSASVPDPNGDPAENRDPEQPSDGPPQKLPTARGFGKPHRAEFLDDLEENFQVTLFGDKRYGTFRKQMVFAGGGFLLLVIVLTVLFWPRAPQPIVETPFPPHPPVPTPAPSLDPEQTRLVEIEKRHASLRQAGQDRNWPKIEEIARQVLQIAPTDGEAWNYLGWVLEKNGDVPRAIDAYGKAIEGGFIPSLLHLKRANMYRLAGRREDAVRDVDEAVRLDPDSIVAVNLQIIVLIEAGRADEARGKQKTFELVNGARDPGKYLLGAAALALHEGDVPKAANIFAQLRPLIVPQVFAQLLEDPYFAPYRNEPALLPFFLIGNR